MSGWEVKTTDEFDTWFKDLGEAEKVEIAALVGALKVVGPQLRRPHADTLNGSTHANMKELRGKTAGAVLRIAFAFDPLQRAILLVGGDKSGVDEKFFYRQLIAKADRLYAAHLRKAEKEKEERLRASKQAGLQPHKLKKGKGKH